MSLKDKEFFIDGNDTNVLTKDDLKRFKILLPEGVVWSKDVREAVKELRRSLWLMCLNEKIVDKIFGKDVVGEQKT